jgi:hypothetical protein
LSEQLQSLKLAANHAAGFVKARGAVPVVHLYDVPNHVREVMIHDAHRGAVVALAMAQVCSGHELQHLPQSFPPTDHPEDHERLVNDFFNTTSTVPFSILAGDIMSKVFSGP